MSKIQGVNLSNDILTSGATAAQNKAVSSRNEADDHFSKGIDLQNQGKNEDAATENNLGYQKEGDSVNFYLKADIKLAARGDNIDDAIKSVQDFINNGYDLGKDGKDMNDQASARTGQGIENGLVAEANSLTPEEFLRIANLIN